MYKKYTIPTETKEQFFELRKQGMPIKEISNKLNITYGRGSAIGQLFAEQNLINVYKEKYGSFYVVEHEPRKIMVTPKQMLTEIAKVEQLVVDSKSKSEMFAHELQMNLLTHRFVNKEYYL